MQLIRRKDAFDERVLFFPQPYYWIMTACAVIFVFPFIPYYIDGEWVGAYYVLLPASIIANVIRILQLNWRIEVAEETADFRNFFGASRKLELKGAVVKSSVLRSHIFISEHKRIFISNDVLNTGSLIRQIDAINRRK
ncbi:MAG: hypothetical protein J5772_01165 [Clostridia bacterium]|nr:hypothetical protein [Clostridia bacterium]